MGILSSRVKIKILGELSIRAEPNDIYSMTLNPQYLDSHAIPDFRDVLCTLRPDNETSKQFFRLLLEKIPYDPNSKSNKGHPTISIDNIDFELDVVV